MLRRNLTTPVRASLTAGLVLVACASRVAPCLAGAGVPAPANLAALTSSGVRWASGVVAFSSQYGAVDYSAAQTLGYPNTWPRYADLPTSWASASADNQREFIELSFDDPAVINYVTVF